MVPEESDGLDDAELPSRTVAAGKTQFERLRRILIYAGTRSAPSASDETGGTLGSMQTAEGRRSARLTSLAATDGADGTADDNGETRARIAFNIREERRVLDRLQAALPPPVRLGDTDFPETGGSTLMGGGWEVYCNGPPARSASTTEAGDDTDSTAAGGTVQGTVGGPPTLTAAAEAMPRMCVNHGRCGHMQALPMCVYAGYCCGECAHTDGREHTEHCHAGQITEMHGSGSAETEEAAIPNPRIAEAELVLNDTTPAEIRF